VGAQYQGQTGCTAARKRAVRHWSLGGLYCGAFWAEERMGRRMEWAAAPPRQSSFVP